MPRALQASAYLATQPKAGQNERAPRGLQCEDHDGSMPCRWANPKKVCVDSQAVATDERDQSSPRNRVRSKVHVGRNSLFPRHTTKMIEHV